MFFFILVLEEEGYIYHKMNWHRQGSLMRISSMVLWQTDGEISWSSRSRGPGCFLRRQREGWLSSHRLADGQYVEQLSSEQQQNTCCCLFSIYIYIEREWWNGFPCSIISGMGLPTVVPANPGWDWSKRLQQLHKEGLCWEREETASTSCCIWEVTTATGFTEK